MGDQDKRIQFEYEDKMYELYLSMKRVEMIENVLDKSLLGLLSTTKGMLKISDAKVIMGYSMRNVDGEGGYQSPKIGMEVAEALIKTKGINYVLEIIADAMERDCPFFFQNA